MKKIESSNTQQKELLQCSFSDLKVCLKQSPTVKLNMEICTNCLLGRIEKHLFSIVKKMYEK